LPEPLPLESLDVEQLIDLFWIATSREMRAQQLMKHVAVELMRRDNVPVTMISEKLHISRPTLYTWLKAEDRRQDAKDRLHADDPEYQEAVDFEPIPQIDISPLIEMNSEHPLAPFIIQEVQYEANRLRLDVKTTPRKPKWLADLEQAEVELYGQVQHGDPQERAKKAQATVDDLLLRVARNEVTIWGQEQTGSLRTRIDKISEALYGSDWRNKMGG